MGKGQTCQKRVEAEKGFPCPGGVELLGKTNVCKHGHSLVNRQLLGFRSIEWFLLRLLLNLPENRHPAIRAHNDHNYYGIIQYVGHVGSYPFGQ